MNDYTVCMTIAGSDPSGGAGIQADLKTFSKLGCYGQAAVTTLTVQSTRGVVSSAAVNPDLVYAQVAEVMTDWMPQAVKIGIVPDAGVARVIVRLLEEFSPTFIVFDPVLVSSSGLPFVDEDNVRIVRETLLPLCSLVTPNIPEAQTLVGCRSDNMLELASRLQTLAGGDTAVLVKGGHKNSTPVDVLSFGEKFYLFDEEQRVSTPNTHGTGCVLSSAIAAYYAKGLSLPEAISSAKRFLVRALTEGAGYRAGKGCGPLYLLP